jgi:hypothetical protein
VSHHAALPARHTVYTHNCAQRSREFDVLHGTDAWDVELAPDEQWGRVLVATRNFAPGELVIRSTVANQARSAAEYVRQHDADVNTPGADTVGMAQFIEYAASSPE